MRFNFPKRPLQMRFGGMDGSMGRGRGRGRFPEGDIGEQRGGGRLFKHGGLKFVLLHLLSEKPAHGYELIKIVEERLGGGYSPSPGTVYPTLTLLEEQGYLASQSTGDAGNRKSYSLTDEGKAFLQENKPLVDAMLERLNGSPDGAGMRANRPAPVSRAIENLKTAIRLRLSGSELTAEQANAFAAILDHAAQQVEKI